MDLCCSSTGRLIAHQCSFEETVKLSPMIEEVHLKQGYYFKSGGSILPSFHIFFICQILGVSNTTKLLVYHCFLFCSKAKLRAIIRIETLWGVEENMYSWSVTFSKRIPQFLASTLSGVGARECGKSLTYIPSSRERVYYRQPGRSVYSQFVGASKNVTGHMIYL